VVKIHTSRKMPFSLPMGNDVAIAYEPGVSEPKTVAGIRSDRAPRVFVWSVWGLMMLTVLLCIGLYGRNIPLAEDWLLVPALTGNEPSIGAWLWAQNNEHRIPLPKLLLLLLLKLTGGDFRAGMVFNTLVLSGLAAAMIEVARRLRGVTSYADAVFPLAILHIGNWDNLVWSWQLTFVVPTVLTCMLLLVIVGRQVLLSTGAAVMAGTSLMLLPLCGANGLIYVPPLAVWVGYAGILRWRRDSHESRWTGWFLLGSVATALLLSALYFAGYVRPWWNPPSPSMAETVKTAAKFLAMAFGPSARLAWPLSIGGMSIVLLVGAVLLLRAFGGTRDSERLRAVGLLLFFVGLIMLALGVGFGRAALVPTVGMPSRYALIAVPLLCVCYFIWELYGSPIVKKAMQFSLLIVMAVLLPMNMQVGFAWRDWYRQGVEAFEHDVMQQVPRCTLAERHRPFLLHWDQALLASDLRMLHETGFGPLRRMRDDSSAC